MSDYSGAGAQPVDDAAVEDPPTEEEVREAQERDHPDQAQSRVEGARPTTAPTEDDDPTDEHGTDVP